MPTLAERLQFAAETFLGRSSQGRSAGPPGNFSIGTTWLGGPAATDAWGAKRAPSPYELVESFKSLAFSCANINADAVSAVPLRLYADSSRDGKRPSDRSDPKPITRSHLNYLRKMGYVQSSAKSVVDIHEIRNYPFLNTLNNPDPNGDFDLPKILKLIVICMDVLGRAYFYPEGSSNRPYQWFWPLFSQYVIPVREAASPVVKTFQYFNERLDRSEIVWFGHKTSLRDPYGAAFPPLYAAIEYARLEDKFVSVQDQLLAMGPRPNLLASPRDPNMPVGEAERLRFEQDLQRKHARSAQGGVLVTSGSWDISPLSYSPTDLSGLKIAEYDLERICGAFDIPVEFFSTDTNLANSQVAEEQHAKRGVRPRCVTIANCLTRIVKQWDDRLFFAFDNVFPQDEEREAKIQDMKIKNGSMTWNQANIDSEHPPHPDGDEPWIPTNLAPVSKLLELHDAAIKAAHASASGKLQGGGNAALKAKDKKKSNGNSKGSSNSGKSGKSGKSGGSGSKKRSSVLPDETDGRSLTEGEDRSPFSWEEWIAAQPLKGSANPTPQKPS